jgi:hypothetical protein
MTPETRPMAGKDSDKVQREIEELLEQLDNFVPEERLAAKIRNRRRQRPQSEGPSTWQRFTSRISRVTLGQIMLAGLACLLVSFLFDDPLGRWAGWLTIAGIVMTAGAFILSIMRGGGSRSTIGGRVQKRWRGQVIEYGEPTTMERVKGWFRRRGRG